MTIIYGREKKIRVNTASQSPTPLRPVWCDGLDHLMDFAQRMSRLDNVTALDCANYVLTLFSDRTKKVTMQNLFHNGGFSSMGMSRRAMKLYGQSLEKELKEYEEKNMEFLDVKQTK